MPGIGERMKASFDAWIAKQNEDRVGKKPKKGTGSIKTPVPYSKGGGLLGGGQREQLRKMRKD